MTGVDDGWAADVAIDVAVLPERVWAVVSDLSRHPVLAGSGEVLAVRMNGPLAVGTTFESDVKTGEVGSFSPRCVIEDVNESRRLAWVSLFPLEPGETPDHQIEVHWSFEIAPTSVGSQVDTPCGSLLRRQAQMTWPPSSNELIASPPFGMA